jgi:hypothetical protein
MNTERLVGHHEAKEALVLAVAGVAAIMLIESLSFADLVLRPFCSNSKAAGVLREPAALPFPPTMQVWDKHFWGVSNWRKHPGPAKHILAVATRSEVMRITACLF